MNLKKKVKKTNSKRIVKKSELAKNIKPKKPKRKPYFGKDAHNAVVSYQAAECRKEKNKIYEEKIEQNINHKYSFSYLTYIKI